MEMNGEEKLNSLMHRITAGLVLFAMLAGINSACIH
jgi:hypothetical protein